MRRVLFLSSVAFSLLGSSSGCNRRTATVPPTAQRAAAPRTPLDTRCPVHVAAALSCPAGWHASVAEDPALNDYQYRVGPRDARLCVPVASPLPAACCDSQAVDGDGRVFRFGDAHTPTGNCG
jgi:hypothetical protein